LQHKGAGPHSPPQQGEPTAGLMKDPDWHWGPAPWLWQYPCATHTCSLTKQQPPGYAEQSLTDAQPHTPVARHEDPELAELQSLAEVQPHPFAVQAVPAELFEQLAQAPPPGCGQIVLPEGPTHFPPLQQVPDAHWPAPPSHPGEATQLPPEHIVFPVQGVPVVC
jgi:hypothetical protein